jgi:hypothetical protein
MRYLGGYYLVYVIYDSLADAVRHLPDFSFSFSGSSRFVSKPATTAKTMSRALIMKIDSASTAIVHSHVI